MEKRAKIAARKSASSKVTPSSNNNQQEQQAKNKHQGIKANNERFAAGLFRQPQAVTHVHNRSRSISTHSALFQKPKSVRDMGEVKRQRTGSYFGG